MTTEKFDHFMQEVQEDLQHERFAKLWQQYGKTFLAICSAVLLLAISYNIWQNYNANKSLKIAEKFVAAQQLAMKQQHEESANLMEEIAKDSHHGYSLLAKLNLANSYSKDNLNKALAIYQEIIANKHAEKIFRDWATILSVQLRLSNLSPKTPKMRESLFVLIDEITPLTTESSFFMHIAKELKGIMEMQAEDYLKAAETFISLSQDKNTPAEMQSRIQMLKQFLSAKIASNNK